MSNPAATDLRVATPTAGRRDQILRAAGRVVLDEGFGRLSARDIAKAIGVSAGLLHHYFPSMDTIRAAAIELFAEEDLDQLRAAIGPGSDPPLLRLDRLIRFGAPEPTDPSCRLWIDAWTEAFHNPLVRDAIASLSAAWLDATTELIVGAVQSGDAKTADPVEMARTLLALLDGLAVQVHIFETMTTRQSIATIRRIAESELGLRPGTLAVLARRDRKRQRVVTVAS